MLGYLSYIIYLSNMAVFGYKFVCFVFSNGILLILNTKNWRLNHFEQKNKKMRNKGRLQLMIVIWEFLNPSVHKIIIIRPYLSSFKELRKNIFIRIFAHRSKICWTLHERVHSIIQFRCFSYIVFKSKTIQFCISQKENSKTFC